MKKFFSNKIFLSGVFLLLGSFTVWSVWGASQPKLNQGEIKTREDSQYVYYDVMLDNVKPSNLEVNVTNGKILIAGQLQIQNNVDGVTQGFVTRYEKAIPAPRNVSMDKYDVAQGRGKVTIRFKKSENS